MSFSVGPPSVWFFLGDVDETPSKRMKEVSANIIQGISSGSSRQNGVNSVMNQSTALPIVKKAYSANDEVIKLPPKMIDPRKEYVLASSIASLKSQFTSKTPSCIHPNKNQGEEGSSSLVSKQEQQNTAFSSVSELKQRFCSTNATERAWKNKVVSKPDFSKPNCNPPSVVLTTAVYFSTPSLSKPPARYNSRVVEAATAKLEHLEKSSNCTKEETTECETDDSSSAGDVDELQDHSFHPGSLSKEERRRRARLLWRAFAPTLALERSC